MMRLDVINRLIEVKSYRSYLEIGMGLKIDRTFESVIVASKISVDPHEIDATYVMTSDEFFAGPGNERRWDLIFIDGLHHADQVHRDIENALQRLNEGGTIVVHDCNPTSEIIQRVPHETIAWTGDVWKAWAWYRMNRSDLSMYVIDVDYGCGVIQLGSQKCFPQTEVLDYTFLLENRKELLNLISWEDWNAS